MKYSKQKSKDLPVIPADKFNNYDYVYVKNNGYCKIIKLCETYTGYDVKDSSLQIIHVEEDDILRILSESEIKTYNKNIDFEIEMSYLRNSM